MVTAPGEAQRAVENIDEHNHLITVTQRMGDNLFCELFWGFVLLHLHTPVAWHCTPSYKMSKSSTPKNNHLGGKK